MLQLLHMLTWYSYLCMSAAATSVKSFLLNFKDKQKKNPLQNNVYIQPAKIRRGVLGQVPSVPMLNIPGTGLCWKKPQAGMSLAQLWFMTGHTQSACRSCTSHTSPDTVTGPGESASPAPPTALIHGHLGAGLVGRALLP